MRPAALALLGVLALAGAFAPRSRTAPAPQPVGDFTLPDEHGKPRSLDELSGRRLTVLVLLSPDCPLARALAPRLAALARAYRPRGVSFVGINVQPQSSSADFVRATRLPFPLLLDAEHAVVERLGAERAPQAFLLDDRRIVRYRGRVDDQLAVGARRDAPTRHDLAEALDELLAGKPVSRPRTEAVGCRITRRRAPSAHAVTYHRHVAAVLRRRCVECHRPGEAGPFPLTTYADAAAWSAMLREVVADGRMPPWFASPAHGDFRNDARLSAEEKRLLLAWVDAGCPEGDPSDRPPAAPFVRGWRIPRPDRIIPMADKPHPIPAAGEVRYEYFTVDPGLREDHFVRAAEVRPVNRAAVHHALVFLLRPGEAFPGDSLGALLDYAPGMAPTVLPEGHAIHVPAGSQFVFQLHYTPTGVAGHDLTRLGLVFADKREVKKLVRGGAVLNTAIDIPPGAPDYVQTAELTLEKAVRLVSLSPHLHRRGKAFRFEAVYPGGRREVLLDVPRYDFNWQLRYELRRPKRLPAGTKLVCTARWDNSAGNPNNPDPTRAVTWGDQTSDEMLIGFFAYVEE